MESGLGEEYIAKQKKDNIYALKWGKRWKHIVNKDNVSFLALQFKINKTTLFSFQQINQTTAWVQWHPIVSYGFQNECEVMCVLLGRIESSPQIPPARSQGLSFSVRTPCKSLFFIWRISLKPFLLFSFQASAGMMCVFGARGNAVCFQLLCCPHPEATSFFEEKLECFLQHPSPSDF